MSSTLHIYTHIDEIFQFHNLDFNDNKTDESFFDTYKYSTIEPKYNKLIDWTFYNAKCIEICNYNYHLLDDKEKLVELRDKIWNNEIPNDSINYNTNNLDFCL